MDRRQVLRVLFGAVLSVPLAACMPSARQDAATEALRAALPTEIPRAAWPVGEAWDGTALPSELLADLVERLGPRGVEVYAEAVAQDFETGDVVEVEGWLLARTEVVTARLAGTLARG